MKSCGVILTYISRQDFIGKTFWVKLRTAFFNCKIFIGQFAFMIVGTAYGKIKWGRRWRWPNLIDVCILGVYAIAFKIIPGWWNLPLIISYPFVVIAIIRGIPWRRVWRAAQCSHVRLCLRELGDDEILAGDEFRFQYINFGYPEAKMDYWRIDQCKGNFEYRNPTFELSPEFIEAMIEYAEAQVDKPYDELQLISSGFHLIAWIVMPWKWGKELKIIKALNRPGGLEDCISGVTACLRWGENREECPICRKNRRVVCTNFFKGYSTATTFPCMVPLSKNWEEVKQ